MLSICWIIMSFIISFMQLVALSQPEWIVNGHYIQGLFVICNSYECILRPLTSWIPFCLHLIGSLLYLSTAIALVPIVCCTKSSRPVQCIAVIQLVSSISMSLTLFILPLDISDIECSIQQLLKSFSCRTGWAFAVSAVCCMLSICGPVLGKLSVEKRKQYQLLRQEHFF